MRFLLYSIYLAIVCSLGGHRLVVPDGLTEHMNPIFVSCRCSRRAEWVP